MIVHITRQLRNLVRDDRSVFSLSRRELRLSFSFLDTGLGTSSGVNTHGNLSLSGVELLELHPVGQPGHK